MPKVDLSRSNPSAHSCSKRRRILAESKTVAASTPVSIVRVFSRSSQALAFSPSTAASPPGTLSVRGTERRAAARNTDESIHKAVESHSSSNQNSASEAEADPSKSPATRVEPSVSRERSLDDSVHSDKTESTVSSLYDVGRWVKSKKVKKMVRASRKPNKKDVRKCSPLVPSPHTAPSNATSSSATPAAFDAAFSTGYVVGPDEPPLTVAVPGRCEEIQRITCVKPSPKVYDLSLLQCRVRGIWESLDHGSSTYFSPEATSIFNQANRA